MLQRKRLGIPTDLYCKPLTRHLATEEVFDITSGPVAMNAIALRDRDLDAAIISPLDFAREGSEYSIIPGVAVASMGATGTVVLHFREGIRNINTLAVDPSSTSEIILTTILLAEQFDLRPKVVPVMGSLEAMLGKADAALLAGDAALAAKDLHQNQLDLVEAWNDLTGLPFVHGIWCSREQGLTPEDVLKIQRARDEGVRSLLQIGRDASGTSLPPEEVKQYVESFTYDFSESVSDGLSEFLRYAYYHGILPDVPDLRFYGIDPDADEPEPPLSLN